MTPNPAKAPWYFVWLQELVASTTIHLGPYTVSGALLGGILVPGILFAVLAIWPFLDRAPLTAEGVWFARTRRRQNLIFAAISVLVIILIFVGVFLRGPYWRLYWLGTPRPVMPTMM